MVNVKIIIENLKSIKHLKFYFEIKKGILVIAGGNGSGKSTLMISIAKLIRKDVLDREFKTVCKDAKISYIINDKDSFVWLQKNNKQNIIWAEENKLEMPIIEKSFHESSTNGARFYQLDNRHKKDKIYTNERVEEAKYASDFIVNNLNWILYGQNNGFFDNLKIFSYYFENNKNRKVSCFLQKDNYIITEFDLSTGEYFLLSLIKIISGFNEQLNRGETFKHTRLLLIDEIDIGLHPLAQKRLIEKLQEWKDKYNLLIIIATHSLQILEQIDGKDIYYIENDKILNPIHRGYITSQLYEHQYYDRIILVEDNLSLKFIEKIIKENINISNLVHKIIPIGGYMQVLSIQELNVTSKIYGKAKVISILDGDIKGSEYINKYEMIEKNFLPFKNIEYYTLELLQTNEFKEFMQRLLYPTNLENLKIDRIGELLSNEKELKNLNTDKIKNIYAKIIEQCSNNTKKEKTEIENNIIDFIVKYDLEKGHLKNIVAHLNSFFDNI